MEFDKDGKMMPKRLKKVIKRDERFFDDDDLFDTGLLVNYEED